MKLSQGPALLAFIILITGITAAQTSSQRCPVIAISCPTGIDTEAPVKFFARIDGPVLSAKPEFKWSVSTGTIIEGQGTATITVRIDDLSVRPIIATLHVTGIGDCSTSSTCTTESILCALIVKFDEYGALGFKDENARLDNFAIQLKRQSNAKAHIIGYSASGRTAKETDARLRRTKDYLVKNRGVDVERVVIQNGGEREESLIQLYILPIDAVPPQP